jgi:beta-aspartyl-peptidase (threonine type)
MSLKKATSTGGLSRKLPGRVGDSPLVGCGIYADNETGGISGNIEKNITVCSHRMGRKYHANGVM